MRINYSKVTLFLTFFFSITTLFAQQSTAVSNYDYQEAFCTSFLYKMVRIHVQQADNLEQNISKTKADYQLTASLDDKKSEITGTEILTYTNNSPDKLSFLWMNVDPKFI